MMRMTGFSALIALCTAVAAPPAAAQPNPRWTSNDSSGSDGYSLRCESRNYRYARCQADTRSGVRLSRVLGGDCKNRRNWGTERNFIWVNNGCRAEFQVGGNGGRNDGGVSTGAVIAGAAVAAGLLALLLSKNKKRDGDAAAESGNKPPAAIDIGQNLVPPAAERAFRRCIDEAARQIGSSGGTKLRLTGDVMHRQFEGAWQFRLPLEGTWPTETLATPAECTATDKALRNLDFLAKTDAG